MGFKVKRRYGVSDANNMVKDPTLPDRFKKLLSKKLSDTDRSIILSMESYYIKKSALSAKQNNFFISLEQRYSDQRIKETADWYANFDNEKRERFKMAVQYYKMTSYFSDIVRIATANPDYIPTEKHYKSMCHNKYFDRALEFYNAEPKYALADIVVFRQNRKSFVNNRDKELVYMVEWVSENGSFYASGRTYKLLQLGSEESVTVLEDEIKLYREKKNV